jgi:hypothetical protein
MKNFQIAVVVLGGLFPLVVHAEAGYGDFHIPWYWTIFLILYIVIARFAILGSLLLLFLRWYNARSKAFSQRDDVVIRLLSAVLLAGLLFQSSQSGELQGASLIGVLVSFSAVFVPATALRKLFHRQDGN